MGVRARGREERMRRGSQEEGGRVGGGGRRGGEGEGEGVSISMVVWGVEGWELFIVDWEGGGELWRHRKVWLYQTVGRVCGLRFGCMGAVRMFNRTWS